MSQKYRITEEGIQNVYDEGNFTLVKYDDKVGDSYSIKVDGKKLPEKWNINQPLMIMDGE